MICNKCNLDKLPENFYRDASQSTGRRCTCIECMKFHFGIRIKKYDKEYRIRNRAKKNDYQKSRCRLLKNRYKSCQSGARRRHLAFELSFSQFENLTKQVCIYCGKFSENQQYVGIDRINNDIGYVLSNCVPCCANCNRIKSTSTFEEIEVVYIGMKRLLNK